MKIGLTYDLRSEYLAMGYSEEDTAEFDRDDTIESIAAALEELGHEPDRIGHIRQLTGALPPATAGSWYSTFARVCEALLGKHRSRRCSKRTAFPAHFLTR